MDAIEFQAMVDAEEHHWWYRGRRLIVRCQLDRLLGRPGLELLDAGCGSGRMMDELRSYASVSGLDSNPDAVELARSRGHPRVRLGRVEEMPYRDGRFDVVTCLDVLEHTRDDVRSLSELRRVTRAGGHLVVTVPAYRFLWSTHDVVNHHYRRYRRSALRSAAREAGWEVVKDTYFNSVLFPPAAVLRLLRRAGTKGRERSDLVLTPRWLDFALVVPLRVEAFLLRLGGRLPAGLSLLAILRNPDEPQRQSAKDDDRGHLGARGLLRAGSQEMSWQFVKFLVVGTSNTLISLVAYVLAVWAGVPYLLASIAAFSLGAVNGYSLNRVWTFRAGAFAPSGLLRYGAVQALGLAANSLLLLALVEGTRLDRILAQALVLPLVSVLTFALNRSWAFRSGTARWRRELATASELPSDLGPG